MAEWQPIESAPRDGTRIILFTMDERCHSGDGFVGEGYWADETLDDGGSGWRLKGEFRKPTSIAADLWQPMPKAPTVEWSYRLIEESTPL